MRTRRIVARYIDHRNARRYNRAAGRAVDAIHAMADLEAAWQDRDAVDLLELMATRVADLADEMTAEIVHGIPSRKVTA